MKAINGWYRKQRLAAGQKREPETGPQGVGSIEPTGASSTVAKGKGAALTGFRLSKGPHAFVTTSSEPSTTRAQSAPLEDLIVAFLSSKPELRRSSAAASLP
jgi:hypothetical protein